MSIIEDRFIEFFDTFRPTRVLLVLVESCFEDYLDRFAVFLHTSTLLAQRFRKAAGLYISAHKFEFSPTLLSESHD